ncbi:MAG: vitamin K epoxide reductase family protein [Actinobacteria bacterium]|jgi:uncharacterized membrane protein|nr:vitamin K epoxide reductase family protein [Actinomycetota bacterium]NDI24317.1 vitamin K epoxide reductase family protein [Actinomycetota bacterium]
MTDTTPTFASETRNSKVSGITLLLAAIAGFLASFVLTIDKLKILKDSNYKPSCNINAVLNCKSVMLSQEAEVFGFPNSLIGIAAFAMMLVVAVSLLMGVEFPKRFWQLLVPGPIFAVGFSHYLAYQTTFEIGALCPYCMVAWVASLLTLAVAIRELIGFAMRSTSDDSRAFALQTIARWMIPIHILWAAILMAGAYIGI